MNRCFAILALFALSFVTDACEKKTEIGTMTDSRDGQTYRTVKIGEQVWMAENLNFKTDSSWCYNDEESNCQKYGRLYSWNAAKSACPADWHLPSKAEFETLFRAVGGTQDKENEKKWMGAGTKLKSTSGWESSAKGLAFGLALAMPAHIKSKDGLKNLSDLSISSNGTDDFSFTALPAGIKEVYYNYEGFYAEFWSSTEVNSEFANNAQAYKLHLVSPTKTAVLNGTFKEFGLSVRCVKGDGETAESSSGTSVSSSSSLAERILCDVNTDKNCFRDSRDGQTYKTVKIGDQVWMAENLNYASDSSSWCYHNEVSYCSKYGRQYSWSAAMDSVGTWSANGKGCGYGKTCSPTYPVRGICPEGWHLPTKAEFETLFTAVGGSGTACKILKSTIGWKSSGNGTDAFGFSALPAGYRNYRGDYDYEGINAYFWSSTEDDSYYAYYLNLYYSDDDAYLGRRNNKNYGFSVRCVKD